MNAAVRSRLLLWGGAALVVALDQLSKSWVVHHLPAYTPVDWIPQLASLLSFTFVKNTGVAFGLFPQLGGLFTILSAIVIAGIFVFHRVIAGNDLWVYSGLGLVTGGALGNLVDRLTRHYVVDFIDVNFWPFREWPVFNIADSAVVAGVAVLLLDALLFGEEEAMSDVAV
ncbi:MAG: signal peptidase II [Anaerolineae bacterium]|nr:signal peptidase II [Anaerolineae bacterium]